VHFTGKLPYAQYLALLQVSALHIYLTVPFVLSWSCLEAMSAGCLILASDTAPVAEAIADGSNGLLCDFHDPAEIAGKAATALAARGDMAGLRKAARQTVLERYDLSRCLPAQMALVSEVAGMRG
jgi:glycosyltransferase involved in cell wall biosynthesis